MIRLLQIVMGILILYFLYLTVVSALVILPMMIQRTHKEPESWKGITYSLRQESFYISPANMRFAKEYKYDSLNHEGDLVTYIEVLNMKPLMMINDSPYAKGKNGQLVKLNYNKESNELQVPIPVSRFNAISLTFLAILIIYLLFVIYLSYQLLLFARLAGRKEFFNQKNRMRLRILGAFMLLTALTSYFLQSSAPWILQTLTGTSGFKFANSPVLSYPAMFIAGILMFIIAEAFSKGQQLQTEQEYTI